MSRTSSNPIRAIIVDDSPTLRVVLAAYLLAEDIQIIAQLSTGQALLHTIAKMSPDIVCLDYNLPDSNGIDLLKSIAAEYPNVAVVMITGETDPSLKSAAAEAGAAGFINKPFSQVQIAKEFKQIVQSLNFLTEFKKTARPVSDGAIGLGISAKALVVDDSKTIRALLVAILSQSGTQVIGEATNGLQAVEMTKEFQPDIVFMDLVMPVMGGMEALKQIQATCPATKVVMITASGSREQVLESIKQGASGFIVKPLIADKVTEALVKVLGS